MPAKPIERLARAICAITDDGKPVKVVDLARACGVDGLLGRRAAQGITINVDAYLKLCAAAGIDPATGGRLAQDFEPADLQWEYVALALKGERLKRKHKIAAAKHVIGQISDATISRVENGHECSIDHFLSICAYIGRHPFSMVVSRSHVKHPVKDIENIAEASA